MPRTPLVVANWKMNTSLAEALALAKSAAQSAMELPSQIAIGIAPPVPWIVPISEQLQSHDLLLGAQDVSRDENGAHTGDVSAVMLAPYCAFVVVGHSERRLHHGETDVLVNAKLRASIASGIRPLLCVGETLAQREQGSAIEIILASVAASLEDIDPASLLGIAYEPVWAIGTGKAASASDAEEMTAAIRGSLSTNARSTGEQMRMLYGGSVNPANVSELTSGPNVDGALVGNASLDMSSMRAIIRAVAGLN